jgi:hypothetical protein
VSCQGFQYIFLSCQQLSACFSVMSTAFSVMSAFSIFFCHVNSFQHVFLSRKLLRYVQATHIILIGRM